MATRPPDHPAAEGAVLQQPGAVSASRKGRIRFKTDPVLPPTPNPNSPEASATSEPAQAFLTLALDRWRSIDAAETRLRQAFREDLEFFASDQWPDKIRRDRERDGRPCLTVNRLPGFVRQVTNEMRDARPGIEVIPVDNFSDPGKAEVRQGLIQHIEANSDADVAYARAAEAQVRVGRGFFRILPEYADDTSFEQELRIRSIRNPNTVYFDHASQELDGSDARYAFVVEDLPQPEYDARFGAGSRLSLTEFLRQGQAQQDWMPEGKVRVAEYYYFEPKQRTIHKLRNGWVIDDDDLKRLTNEYAELVRAAETDESGQTPPPPPLDLTPLATRTVQGRQLMWALINGAMVLDGNEDKTAGRALPGRWIPIIPVYGEEIDLDGLVDFRGIIRDAKDAQRMTNFWRSAETETIALAPKAPMVAEEGQIENHEDEWKQANVRNIAVLTYKAKSLEGHLIPAPQRNAAEPPIQAMAMLALQMENDLRATVGFSYDVGSQEKRVEQSGRAILARQAQGEKGNSHFTAHLAVSLRHAGRILLDLLPAYYDTPRVKRILGRDGQPKAIVLHAGNPDAAQQIALEQGLAEASIHDLTAGRYDVRVKAGVSYASQRQQDQELVANALQTNPGLFQVIGDLFFKTLDSPIAERISQRLQKALPPGLQEPQEGQPPPIPPQLQQQLQQMDQVIAALTQRLNEMTEAQRAKREELASKERIAQIQAEVDIAVAQSKAVSSEQVALLEAKMRAIEQLIAIDMARLQALSQATSDSSSRPAPATAPTAAPPSPEGQISPMPAPLPPPPTPVSAG